MEISNKSDYERMRHAMKHELSEKWAEIPIKTTWREPGQEDCKQYLMLMEFTQIFSSVIHS